MEHWLDDCSSDVSAASEAAPPSEAAGLTSPSGPPSLSTASGVSSEPGCNDSSEYEPEEVDGDQARQGHLIPASSDRTGLQLVSVARDSRRDALTADKLQVQQKFLSVYRISTGMEQSIMHSMNQFVIKGLSK